MSLVGTFVHHPRKLWLRRALFQVHLWVGVLVSLYIVLIALTGSVLVFRAELTRLALPKQLSAYDPAHVAPVATIVRNFAAVYPGTKLDDLYTPTPATPAYILNADTDAKKSLKFVGDPVTGQVWPQPRTWLDVVYDFHLYLLLNKSYGMAVNGAGAGLLMVLTFSGIFIWWPGLKLWARGLRVSFKHNWRRINFDAHNAIGFWTLLIVFWWAFSGVYFGYYQPFTAVVNFISPLRGMRSPDVPAQAPALERASLEQVLESAQHASPHGRLYYMGDPLLKGDVVYVLFNTRSQNDFVHQDIVTVATSNARVLTVWHYGENHSAGDWVLWAMHPLHFGTLWGLPVKILWALLGLALAALSITGVLMYWNRYLRHKWKRLASPSAIAVAD